MPPKLELSRRDLLWTIGARAVAGGEEASALPWYRRAYRWGQTNITEKDPERYDIAWWRGFWKRTRVQAVIINAGGIVAYYPSKFPLQHRAEFLKGRDLFGELTEAAHADGIWVMARMDSNRAGQDFFDAHPDWFTRDKKGGPYRAADKYVACINSDYYEEYLPEVLREIAQRAKPDGFTDNSWAGLGRESICYCVNCSRKFREKSGMELPGSADWKDRAYRQWILWSYSRRTEVWELNNRTTRSAGGPDCIWSGMMSGSVTSLARSFRDLREIGSRAEIMMLDHQRRDEETGFQQNGDTGKRVHMVLGWNKLSPESMAMYQSGPGYFRVASKPAAEARMWMVSGIAGGIQPWWHYIGAYHEDRRMYRTPEPVMRWCEANQDLLVDREPVADVGILWSQRNTDFFGRENAGDRVDAPYNGWMQALVRARIPYLPIHVDDLPREGKRVRAIILPNLGAMSNAQCGYVREFVRSGGGLIATGDSSLYNEWGDPRADYGLADALGVHRKGKVPRLPKTRANRAEAHTYLRLSPELRGGVDGPRTGKEPRVDQGEARHAVLKGFDETDLIPFGGVLEALTVESGAQILLTYVPPFPTYPPETAWMREPVTQIPGLVLRERGKSRIVYMPADLDRRYALQHLPDHANLLANVVGWALMDGVTVAVEGPGLIDCHVYRKGGRLLVHLVNLTSSATWRAPMEEVIPVGPVRLTVRRLAGVRYGREVQLRVSGTRRDVRMINGVAAIEIGSIAEHELIVF